MATIPKFVTGIPKRRDPITLFLPVAYTDTTAALVGYLPKGALLVGAYVIGGAVSAAVTSAVIGLGSTTSANEYISGYDVKTAATGEGYSPVGAAAVGSAFATKLTADTPLYVKYTGAGGGDSGSWVIKLEYVVLGPNETLTGS